MFSAARSGQPTTRARRTPHVVSAREATDRPSWRLGTRDALDRTTSERQHHGGAGIDRRTAAGHWSTTRPAPRTCAAHPSRVRIATASRALRPVRSGTSEVDALAASDTSGGGCTGPEVATGTSSSGRLANTGSGASIEGGTPYCLTCRRRDLLEDRRRHDATVRRDFVRRIDDDNDREDRLARRHEADKRHVVVGVASVAAVEQLLRRARLASDGVAVNLRQLPGAVGDDAAP